MTCAGEQVTGYVDDLLDPPARAEMEAHLASCADCRLQVEHERAIRAGLRALPAPEPRPELEAAVRRRLRGERRGRSSWLLPIAAALAVAALWGRGAAPFVAWELVRDHLHCFGADHLPAKTWTNEPREVSRWFEDQGTRLPPVPAQVGDLALVGARYCPLLDRMVAHLYYAGEERHLSIFVFSGPVRFSEAWATQSRGHAVRLLRSAGMTVALVGAHPEDVDAFRKSFTTTTARLPAEWTEVALALPAVDPPVGSW